MHKDHLAMETLLTSRIEYSGDEDGNIAIYQDNNVLYLTPTQQQDLLSLLEVNLDIIVKYHLRNVK